MRRSGLWVLAISITSLQLGAASAKGLFDRIEPMTLVWLRLVLASLLIFVFARPRLGGHTARQWWLVAGYGLSLSIMNLALYQAIARIPLGAAVTIEFLGPLLVAVRGSRRLRDWIWIILAGGGVLLLGSGALELDAVGIGFALLAATAWGSYILLSSKTGVHWSGVSGLAVGTFVGAVLATPFMLTSSPEKLASPSVWLWGLFVALLSTVIPYGLEMFALRRISPAVFGILMSLEPAAAALAAMVVIGEFLGPVEWVAIACVTIASIGTIRTNTG